MVPAHLGISPVNCSTRHASSRWTILVLTAVALALAGCGRKGGLDLPPQASSMQPTSSTAPPPPQSTPDDQTAASKGNALFGTSVGDDSAPSAAKGRKKPFVLDRLVD
jgi:predicted small lipoprotein YifL